MATLLGQSFRSLRPRCRYAPGGIVGGNLADPPRRGRQALDPRHGARRRWRRRLTIRVHRDPHGPTDPGGPEATVGDPAPHRAQADAKLQGHLRRRSVRPIVHDVMMPSSAMNVNDATLWSDVGMLWRYRAPGTWPWSSCAGHSPNRRSPPTARTRATRSASGHTTSRVPFRRKGTLRGCTLNLRRLTGRYTARPATTGCSRCRASDSRLIARTSCRCSRT